MPRCAIVARSDRAVSNREPRPQIFPVIDKPSVLVRQSFDEDGTARTCSGACDARLIDPQGDAFVDADTSPQSYRPLRGEPGGQIMAIGDTLTPISHAPASSRLVS